MSEVQILITCEAICTLLLFLVLAVQRPGIKTDYYMRHYRLDPELNKQKERLAKAAEQEYLRSHPFVRLTMLNVAGFKVFVIGLMIVCSGWWHGLFPHWMDGPVIVLGLVIQFGGFSAWIVSGIGSARAIRAAIRESKSSGEARASS